jgi:hypothetical protein
MESIGNNRAYASCTDAIYSILERHINITYNYRISMFDRHIEITRETMITIMGFLGSISLFVMILLRV